MTESVEQDIDVVPESRAARWAWRVSLIPLFGIPFFFMLAFVALYRIGTNGQAGFYLVIRGIKTMLLVNVVLYFGFYLSGYTGYYNEIYDNAYSILPKHGIYRYYFWCGDSFVEKNFWFGALDGPYNTFYKNGKKQSEGQYSKDKSVGKWTNYSPDGKNSSSYICDEKGIPTGKVVFWYGNGQKGIEGEWDGGKRIGKWIWWHENGQKYVEQGHKNGRWNGIRTVWNKNGQIEECGLYIDGKKDGTWLERDVNNHSKEGYYKNGLKDGNWSEWDFRNVRSTGEYKNNQREGLWTEWRGSIKETAGNYKNGKKDGEWNIWYPNGQLREKSNYKQNRPAGKSQHWDQSGNLIKEQTYNEVGWPVKTIRYKDGKPIEETK